MLNGNGPHQTLIKCLLKACMIGGKNQALIYNLSSLIEKPTEELSSSPGWCGHTTEVLSIRCD